MGDKQKIKRVCLIRQRGKTPLWLNVQLNEITPDRSFRVVTEPWRGELTSFERIADFQTEAGDIVTNVTEHHPLSLSAGNCIEFLISKTLTINLISEDSI